MKALALKAAKWLLQYAMDEGLKRALPEIYKRLDLELPYWYAQRATPTQVQGVIASAVSDGLGYKPAPNQMALVRLLYDPVKAAATIAAQKPSR